MPTIHSADASRSIEWLTRVLGLREVVAHRDDSGRVVHGELA
jgi:catechol 2,3-dioxygenase-like lactoylglutathione lyase family enzyme